MWYRIIHATGLYSDFLKCVSEPRADIIIITTLLFSSPPRLRQSHIFNMMVIVVRCTDKVAKLVNLLRPADGDLRLRSILVMVAEQQNLPILCSICILFCALMIKGGS